MTIRWPWIHHTVTRWLVAGVRGWCLYVGLGG